MKKNKILNKTDLKEAEKYFEEAMNLMKYIKLRNDEEAKNLLLTAINTIKNAIKLNPYEKKYSEKIIFLKNELQKIEKDNIPTENKLSRIEIAKKNGNMLNEKNLPPIKSKIITEESNFAEEYMNKGIYFLDKYKLLRDEKYLLESKKYINKALILDENNKKCISLLNQIDIISKNIANKYNENGFSLLNSLNDENIVNSKDVLLQIKNYCENSILFDIQNIQYKKNLEYINELIQKYFIFSDNSIKLTENTKNLAKKIDVIEIKEKSIDEIKLENIKIKKEFIQSRLLEMDLNPELKTKENFEKIAKAYKGLIELENKDEYWKELGLIYTKMSKLNTIDISQQLYYEEQANDCFDNINYIDENSEINKTELLAKIYNEEGVKYYENFEENEETELLLKSKDFFLKAIELDKTQKKYITNLSLTNNKIEEIAENLFNSTIELFENSKDLNNLIEAKEYLINALKLNQDSTEYQITLNIINSQIAKIYFNEGLTLYNNQNSENDNEDLLFKIKEYFLDALYLDMDNINYKNYVNILENKLENISKNYFEQGICYFKQKDNNMLLQAKKYIEDAIKIDKRNKKHLYTLFNNPFNKEYNFLLKNINEQINNQNQTENITEKNNIIKIDDNYILPKIDTSVTEKSYETTIRIGHEKLRKELLNKYKQCFICGIDIENLLVASHIKPWKKSNDNEKLDYNNVLLLCNKHDSLFDKGFIAFNEEKIIISPYINEKNKNILNLSEKDKLNIKLTESMKKYLKWHFENIFKQ